ncbi:MAG: DUF802 domain-containing protein [Limnohabitans sp.]|nr:DUF802 domain-containing protein [Limnohabitans sp.]
MKRHSFSVAFGLGALAVVWVAAVVASSHLLVLAMAAVIGAVYVVGALELRHYRQATATLDQALDDVPPDLAVLNDWLIRLHPSLHNAVRLRVEGERIALPGPALTPYLVGLLVMLGMLGTFLGMVVTLNGAVFALEGTNNIAGMRAAFSEPIKGLGLAFGTSVAGVATSAMLGLMSSLARRERAQAAQALDAQIATGLRVFSIAHQRQETFKALQQQSQALPQVMGQLQTSIEAMVAQMALSSQQVNERLLSNQDQFHQAVQTRYTQLAQSVDESLRSSLSQSMQVAADSIRPVVQTTLADMAQQAQGLHERMVQTTQQQLGELNAQFSASAQDVANTWATALSQHEQASAGLLGNVGQTLEQVSQTFGQRTEALVASVQTAYAEQLARQTGADQQKQDAWQASLHTLAASLHSQWQQSGEQTLAQQQSICDTLTQTAQAVTQQVQQHAEQTLAEISRVQSQSASADQQRLAAWQAQIEGTAQTLHSQWQQSGEQTLAQQQSICDTLTQTAQQVTEHSQAQATQTLAEITRLMASAEDLMRTRIAAEADWAAQHNTRAHELTALLKSELLALRDGEAERGQAAVDRLTALQSAVAAHLTTLGTALEDPITRLIETASQAPKAAAEVIGQLRQEISVSVARDNELLEERTRIMQTLSGLLDAIHHASTEQRAVIDTLVSSSAVTLEQANDQFAAQVSGESAKLGEIAAQVTSSAIEVASLGETFGFAVRSFNEGNEKLMANLQRIEAAIGQSMTRSDEQLAYYVAQAREMIDLSITSQKDVLEALQSRATAATEGAV